MNIESIISTLKSAVYGKDMRTALVSLAELTQEKHKPISNVRVITTTSNGGLLGDLNNDGVLDIDDKILLQQYMVDNTVPINELAADINGDGVIDTSDLVQLTILLDDIGDSQNIARIETTYTDGSVDSRYIYVDINTSNSGNNGGGNVVAGGYYMPTITQIGNNKLRFSFSPSQSGMPSISPKTITIPPGANGVGIKSIEQTVVSNVDGGVNVITITLTDDSKSTFTVKNGSGGSGGSGDGQSGAGIASITYKGTDANGGNIYTISLTNGSSYDFTAPKGSSGAKGDKGDKGDTGAKGADGYTPVRGTDYWTASDIAEIKSYVDDAILGGAW